MIAKEALWYEKESDDKVRCLLCPHSCTLTPGRSGVCRVRKNVDGTLVATTYAKAGAYALDPIEKKPLYHFYPGTQIFSIGARGCSFGCEFCQNWELVLGNPAEVDITPLGAVHAAEQYRNRFDVIGIAYTYSEPLMWYEFVLDTAELAHRSGLKNVVVTNGYLREEPLKQLLPHVDAMNIDVKGFTEEFYRKYVHGELEPVLRAVETVRKSGCHVELTTLLIPGLNDSAEELTQLVDWICSSLGEDTPLHFSRYFPNHKLTIEPTPVKTLVAARELALEKLHYVYLGNVGDSEAAKTFCPNCHNVVVDRGAGVDMSGLHGSHCAFCGQHISIVV